MINFFEPLRHEENKVHKGFVFLRAFVPSWFKSLVVIPTKEESPQHTWDASYLGMTSLLPLWFKLLFFAFLSVFVSLWPNQTNAQRTTIPLNANWQSVANDSNIHAYDGFQSTAFKTTSWSKVNVPHNWDAYEGYRRMRHGNRHGYAWYRKTFTVPTQPANKRYFLFFEGVGSYATVWLNGKQVGYHAGGRTTFTLDVTDVIKLNDQPNLLAVRADHPAFIKDLPWVCGGCSDERGFSEGSQPMGIFRPVQLVITNDVRIEPFGVHAWNDTTVTTESAQIFSTTEVKNYSNKNSNLTLINRLLNKQGKQVAISQTNALLQPGTSSVIKQEPLRLTNVNLWSPGDPYLYILVTEVVENGKVVDKTTTPYGIRWISWPIGKPKRSNQFLVNGKPVFINGIAEYEHLIGKSHAFSDEQVRTRAMQVKATGFNAFRDGHQPHNLRYDQYWDSLGILWWTQLSAHIWYDTPEFRKNFKQLLTDWVIERRNSPSVVLWGLQNESKLTEDFAKECTELIRQLDPTASSQRLVTTCNGGSGTDWDVPQNWTGTYGGNPELYGEDLKRQVLVGEYGAWRTLDLHTEGKFDQNGIYSEDRMTQLMEMKVRLAEQVKDSTAGHFMWLLTSHDNPGRVQGGEGYRELDRIGPVNYKGLMTPWEEPLDVFYMYRSNYASKDKEPMVYIASHTWPDRWLMPGKKDGVVVYSNCDSVELFNDVNHLSLGKRGRNGIGTHFQWDGVDINFNVLSAVGYVNGKIAAKDLIVLNHLPQAPHFRELYKNDKNITKPQANLNYVCRVNCGGPNYKDEYGNTWLADRAVESPASSLLPPGSLWGSLSWTNAFPGMPAFFASQRRTFDPIEGTKDWKLFQTFRYGREQLKYFFPLPNGEYQVELYFAEPWLGTGGGMDCTGWRLFDVAINDKTVLQNVDLWKEAGHDHAIKKIVKATVKNGELIISFPNVASGQVVISAIAIATINKSSKGAASPEPLIKDLQVNGKPSTPWTIAEWLDTGDKQYASGEESFASLLPVLYGGTYIRTTPVTSTPGKDMAQFAVSQSSDVFIALDENIQQRPEWLKDYEDVKASILNSNNKKFSVYRKRFNAGERVVLGNNGNVETGTPAMYSVIANPVSNIEPAYDLKPVTSYKAVNASWRGPGIEKAAVDGKERIMFKKASADNIMEWDFSIGAADVYSLTISYNNPHEQSIQGRMQLLAADGTLMREEDVEFTNTQPGKSNYINTTTGSMINAGHYKLRLTGKDAEGLTINALDVQ